MLTDDQIKHAYDAMLGRFPSVHRERLRTFYSRTQADFPGITQRDFEEWLLLMITSIQPVDRTFYDEALKEELWQWMYRFLQRAQDQLIQQGKIVVTFAVEGDDDSFVLTTKPQPAPQLRQTERFAILKRDNYRCRMCGATARTAELEVDHITPRIKGGTNDPSNLWVLCFDCNRGKGMQEL